MGSSRGKVAMAGRRKVIRRALNKYRAVRVGQYASRFEATVAAQQRALLQPGETLIEQVPVKFACGAKSVLDFAVVKDGKIVRYIEAKGFPTPVWRLKLRLIRHEHPDVFAMLTIVTPPKRKKKSK
jgi:hypothetical protein